MARLPRLALAGMAHLVTQRAHGERTLFADDADRVEFLRCLRAALQGGAVRLHAYALLADRLWLLLTPTAAADSSRLLQNLGRSYTTAYNRRHGRAGTLWDGRYRCTVVEPGQGVRDAMLFVEQAPVRSGLSAAAGDWAWSSASHHLGALSDPLVSDAAEYWALGNTPFDRAAAYGSLVQDMLPAARAQALAEAATKGWAIGSAAFLAQVQARVERPVAPRPRGRPRSMRQSVPN